MNYQEEIKELVDTLVKEGGSDLHFSVGHNPSARINTELISFLKKPILTKEDTAGYLQVMLDPQKFSEFLQKQEADFSFELDGHRLRGNAFFQKGTIGIALRLLPEVRDIKDLNLPPIIENFAQKEEGFFLVV